VFRRHTAASNSSILAHFRNGGQQKPSNIDDERVSKFQLQGPSQKNFVTLFRDGFRDYFRHAYKLHTSQRQPSTRTVEFTMAAAGWASGLTRAAPGIIFCSKFYALSSSERILKIGSDLTEL